MNVHIRQWGNSAAVRIPAAALGAANLKVDDRVSVREEAGRIIIEPASEPGTITLEWLLQGITPENRHEETDWGPPVGKEFW